MPFQKILPGDTRTKRTQKKYPEPCIWQIRKNNDCKTLGMKTFDKTVD